MTIWLYCVCRDEALLMPYLLRHYGPWVDKLIFYDAGSTDGTREMIEAERLKMGDGKVELRDWPGSDALADDELQCFSSEQWREARGKADWVVWIDADEFLVRTEDGGRRSESGAMRALLARYLVEGITVPHVEGYTMVSTVPPSGQGQIYDEIRTGFPDEPWSKPAIFQPRVEMKYNPGRHSMNTTDFVPVRGEKVEIKLLHYRALGIAYVRARHARNWARVPARCREHSYGVNTEPGHAGHHGASWFEEMIGRTWPEVV